jgi:hypothetical protein
VWLLLLAVIARNALAAADAGNVQVRGQRPQLVFACDSDTPKLQSFFRRSHLDFRSKRSAG